jgi:1,4-alpha-glucan branching enzyme
MNTKTDELGVIALENGTAFRVWAPHARQVEILGTFNDWQKGRHLMQPEENGCWYLERPEAKIGDEFRYFLNTDYGALERLDPCAREVTHSMGNTLIHNPNFEWEDEDFKIESWNKLVIYELHVGTFNDEEDEKNLPGNFESITSRLGHLKKLGVNAIQIMPVTEFAGNRSWGYNPSQIYAVENEYGGALAFKRFINKMHKQGFAVILDVVYNHFGPDDLSLWRFDGWSQNNMGGIYFYNDWRANTTWGETRPDYGREEVRRYIFDNAMMWLNEYHVDGLRFDSTQFIRTVDGNSQNFLQAGWSLLQSINDYIAQHFPGKLTIAEDLQNDPRLTIAVDNGGAGFGAQWDPNFYYPIRDVVIAPLDEQRSLDLVRNALNYHYDSDVFARVVFSESHDAVANGRARVPQEIDTKDPTGWYARKRSTLAGALVFTAPGIPMIFQGQEFLEGGSFRDDVPLDWDLDKTFCGIVNLYRDLISLRLNADGVTGGLCGQHVNVYHVNEESKLVAFHRWEFGGAGDDVIVIANFCYEAQEGYQLGFPAAGTWHLRFNSDWSGYSKDFSNHPSIDINAEKGNYDGFRYQAFITIGAYSALIYSQDKEG